VKMMPQISPKRPSFYQNTRRRIPEDETLKSEVFLPVNTDVQKLSGGRRGPAFRTLCTTSDTLSFSGQTNENEGNAICFEIFSGISE
jgi:hypothetical protein